MKFHNDLKGKIIINVDKVGERLDSSIALKGLANEPDVLMSTLLINYISTCIKNDKDPKVLFEKNADKLLKLIQK